MMGDVLAGIGMVVGWLIGVALLSGAWDLVFGPPRR